jgi:uncharacterized protein
VEGFTYFVLLSVAVFSGAVVSALAGFAFSAVAGAILLHLMPPIEAVPLMMACSILVQVTSLLALLRGVQWRRSLVLAGSGLLGIVPAVYLLQHVDTRLFRVGFGVFVAGYSAYMLLRAAVTRRACASGSIGEGLVGFGGGLIGGLTAMPGALPTIWCDMQGIPKGEQRGLVQPSSSSCSSSRWRCCCRASLGHPGCCSISLSASRRLRLARLWASCCSGASMTRCSGASF